MIPSVPEAQWRALASGLALVRDLLRKHRIGCTRAEERRGLERVANAPAFADLGPLGAASVDRGRWIEARIRRTLLNLEVDCGKADSPASRAVRCWARYVDEGLTPNELYDAYPQLVPHETPPRSPVAARGRVQSLMWAGGARGDKDSYAGVQLIYAEVRTALSTGLPDGPRLDATTFDYEWRRLELTMPDACYLLHVLAQLAPGQPFSRALLRDGGDSLPAGVDMLCENPRKLTAVLNELRERGLVSIERDTLLIEGVVCGHVLRRATEAQRLQWLASVLRFLTHALRADTHDNDSWPQWRVAYPHVLELCAAAEREQVRLGDVVYLLDRASVYARATEMVDTAIGLAERAVRLSTELGPDDAELHGDCLGNLALACRAAGRLKDAVRWSEAGLDHLAATVGECTETYAESLNLHASILAAAGRSPESEEAHAKALAIIRQIDAASPAPHVTAILVETLNDYASNLLTVRGRGRRPTKERLELGRALLTEASKLVRRGDHGWLEIEQNLARACRATGDLKTAQMRLEAILDYCRAELPVPSLPLVAVLVELAEVYDEAGHPRAAETLRQAHEADNALEAQRGRPDRHGRTT